MSIAQNRYSIYGRVDGQQTGRFGFTGQTRITGTDLWHFKARAYDPKLGRFLQPDPIGYGDGLNMYAYAGGDPVNATDPTGLGACGPDAADVCNDIGTGPTIADDILIVRAERPAESSFDLFAFYAANPIDVTFAFQNGEGGGGGGANATAADPTCGKGGSKVDSYRDAAKLIRPDARNSELKRLANTIRHGWNSAESFFTNNVNRHYRYDPTGRVVLERNIRVPTAPASRLTGSWRRELSYYLEGLPPMSPATAAPIGLSSSATQAPNSAPPNSVGAVIYPGVGPDVFAGRQKLWNNAADMFGAAVVKKGGTICVYQ